MSTPIKQENLKRAGPLLYRAGLGSVRAARKGWSRGTSPGGTAELHHTTEVDLQRLRTVIAATVGPEAEASMISGYDKMAAEEQAKGMSQGHANALLRQLQKRFGELPPEVLTRVRTASMPDLDRRTDRILSARTLAEVFAAE